MSVLSLRHGKWEQKHVLIQTSGMWGSQTLPSSGSAPWSLITGARRGHTGQQGCHGVFGCSLWSLGSTPMKAKSLGSAAGPPGSLRPTGILDDSPHHPVFIRSARPSGKHTGIWTKRSSGGLCSGLRPCLVVSTRASWPGPGKVCFLICQGLPHLIPWWGSSLCPVDRM